MKQIAIVAGGTRKTLFLPEIAQRDYVIGVDRGAYWLLAHGITPDIAIGDFDSVTAAQLRTITRKITHVEKHPREKDATDMELAIDHSVALHPKEVIIYGALGGRLDHAVGNIHLLEKLSGIGVIRDDRSEARLIDGSITFIKDSRYRYVSLISLSDTIEVTLSGFLYDVSHVTIRRGQTLGVSNEIKRETSTIVVHRGLALVIRSRD